MPLQNELQATLMSLPKADCYWVAYSGGCDSHVLLHVLYSLSQLATANNDSTINIAAVHVDHGLQQRADEWSRHCEQVCVDFGIKFKLLKVNALPQTGQSPEAAAREARYQAIASFLPQNDALLVAHHQDDQAETLLLQLIRGAGPRGLSAMPKMKLLGDNQVIRPFLMIEQSVIINYAKQHKLDWIDDPSNVDTRFDRNRIRHEVMPVLKQRWPSLSKTLSRVTQHQAEAVVCLRELAELDWEVVKSIDIFAGISIEKLNQLSKPRQKNIVRYWIEQRHHFDAINSAHLNRIFNEVIPAANDSQPKVTWKNTQVCRYRGVLYVLAATKNNAALKPERWHISSALALTGELTGQRLVSKEALGHGIKRILISNETLNIRYRQGGERCQPQGRANHHSLKKLFQEWAIPPWMRSKIPLVYIGDELAQIVGYCICDPFAAASNEQGIVIESENI